MTNTITTHQIPKNTVLLKCVHDFPVPTNPHSHKQEKETEPSWFHLLTQMKWDCVTRNGKNSRLCLEFGTYSKDVEEKWLETDLDSVNELTREQCVTTHTLHFIRIHTAVQNNGQKKWH